MKPLCEECERAPDTYQNYLGQWFCWPCADGKGPTDVTTIDTPPQPAPAAPEPAFRFEGILCLYVLPDDSLVISTRKTGEAETTIKKLEGMYLGMAAGMLGKTAREMINSLLESLA